MTIKRNDLLAAASAGVLHYAEVDSLLIFLVQREAKMNKTIAVPGKLTSRVRFDAMHYLAWIVAFGLALLIAILFQPTSSNRFGMVLLLLFAFLCALYAIGAVARRNIRGDTMVVSLLLLALLVLLPLALYILQ